MKFNTIGPAGFPTLALPYHKEHQNAIINGMQNNGSFTWQVSERTSIPKELTIYLRPMQQVYEIRQDLTASLFSNWNISLAKFVNPTNPCAYVTKLNDFQWWIAGFDPISLAFIYDMDKTMIGLYLSGTTGNPSTRESVIFKQGHEIFKSDLSQLRIATGIVTVGHNLMGASFIFNVVSNASLFETCPSFR